MESENQTGGLDIQRVVEESGTTVLFTIGRSDLKELEEVGYKDFVSGYTTYRIIVGVEGCQGEKDEAS